MNEWKIAQVVELGRTPKGRQTLKIAGEKYGFFVSDDIKNLPNVGQTIEVITQTSQKDGKYYTWLNEWRPVASGEAAHSITQATPDAALRFISNVVGQAIQAKTIDKPEDIRPWAHTAYQVVMECLQDGGPVPFDGRDEP